MTEGTIAERVRRTMAAVFQEDIDRITDDTTPGTLQSWDSIGQMTLIVALEEEFDVRFSDEHTDRLRSFTDAVSIVEDATANAGA